LVAVDWVIVAVLVVSVLVAAAQGFFFEVFSLVGLILGYLLAAWEYWRLAPWFLRFTNSQAAANVAAFLTIFSVVAVLAGIAGKLTRWAMKEAGLGWADRLLGAAFGLVRGVVAVSVAVLAMATFYPDSGLFRGSQLGRYFLITAKAASWVAPSDVRQMFRDGAVIWRKTEMNGSTPSPSDEKKPPAVVNNGNAKTK
jgi:membrane protein required for colicin V production